MYKKTFMQIARRLFLLAAAAGTLVVSGTSQVMAAPGGGGGTPLTCSIGRKIALRQQWECLSPLPPTPPGGKGCKSYDWTFSGPASPTSATTRPRT